MNIKSDSKDSNQNIKILFYIKNASGGGAERCILELFRNFNRNNFEYKLLLGELDGEYLSSFDADDLIEERYALPAPRLTLSSTKIDYFNAFLSFFTYLDFKLGKKIINKLIKNWVNELNTYFGISDDNISNSILEKIIQSKRFWRLRNSLIRYQPDIVVTSLIESGSAVAYLAKKSIHQSCRNFIWVGVEHNNTYDRFFQYYPQANKFKFWNDFTKKIYNETDQIVAVSQGIKQGLIENYNMESHKINVIYNPVDVSSINSVVPLDCERPFILAAGRLHPQKGYDYLLRAYASIASSVNSDLIILGDGDEKNSLKSLAKELEIEESVYFLGFKNNFWSYLKSAECFVLSSRYEGFPLVLIEAMAAKCPVVAFDCKYGPSELIDNMDNGILVPFENIPELAKGIKMILNDQQLSSRLTENAFKKINKYNSKQTSEKYEKLFSSLLFHK